MKTYTFNIQGMTCHGCANIIRMDLEDAGFKDIKKLDHTSGVLEIDLNEPDVDKVKQIIESSNDKKYKVVNI